MEPDPNERSMRSRWTAVAALLVALVVCVAFWPAVGFDFVNWDDHGTVVENAWIRGLSADNLAWMASAHYMGHYHPLTWFSYALDHAVGGTDPAVYHRTNVLLHAANAVLVFWIAVIWMPRMRGALPAAVVAALAFGLHPLRVESVAWVTERRDVLSGFFLLAALVVWIQRCAEPTGTRRMFGTLATLTLFGASLLSKAWGITFPVVLLLLDAYPLRRELSWPARLREKVPFFLLASLFAWQALGAQSSAGAMHLGEQRSGALVAMQALYGLFFYPWKTLLPTDLSPLYLLRPDANPWGLRFLVPAIVVLALSLWLFLRRARRPAAWTAWALFAVLVSPVLGLAQSGPQLAADRYSYLACIPFAVLLGALWQALWGFQVHLAGWTAAALLLLLAGMTRAQLEIWRDSDALWSRAIEVEETHYFAYHNRGTYWEERDPARARRDFDLALRANPNWYFSHSSRGQLRQKEGDVAGAMEDFERAIAIAPDFADAYNGRGRLYSEAGQHAAARADFDRAIELDPGLSEAYSNRGSLLVLMGQAEAALPDLTRAFELDPLEPRILINRASAYSASGRKADALHDLDTVLRMTAPDWELRDRVLEFRALVAGG